MPTTKNDLKWQLRALGYLIGTLLLLEIFNLLTGRVLTQYGIMPRDLSSLGFIFTSPFLHADLNHFLSNIFTLAVFSYLAMQFGKAQYIKASLGIIIITGLMVWLFGRTAYHLGASGVVYGYFGFLVLAGWLSGKLKLLIISVAVAFFYGTMVWGVLPSRPFVSWESHLFGFISGLILAWYLKPKT